MIQRLQYDDQQYEVMIWRKGEKLTSELSGGVMRCAFALSDAADVDRAVRVLAVHREILDLQQ